MFWIRRERARRAGFTLIELLVVLVIAAVMVAVVLPNFTTGSDGVKLRVAARGVVQMARYARTMAVLQQAPMHLTILPSGELRVERQAATGNSPLSTRSAVGEVHEAGTTEDVADNAGTEAGASGGYEMATLETVRHYEGVTFVVTTDETVDLDDYSGLRVTEDELEDEDLNVQTMIAIPFESNGQCLPFEVKIWIAGNDLGDSMTVKVDRFGMARVVEDAE